MCLFIVAGDKAEYPLAIAVYKEVASHFVKKAMLNNKWVINSKVNTASINSKAVKYATGLNISVFIDGNYSPGITTPQWMSAFPDPLPFDLLVHRLEEDHL